MMNRRQRKELDQIILEAKRGLNICMKMLLEEQAKHSEPCNPKIDKVYEYLLKQNIDKYAEKDKAWFGQKEKDSLFDCCCANNYLTIDEVHKAAVSLWPEKYSFTPEPAIKNEVPNNAVD